MKNIGLILKETRESQGLSLEDINKKTKITIRRLQAIEDGDIAYFGDDISYIQYYVKLYSQALNLNFDELKEELGDALDNHIAITQTQILLDRKQMEDNIREKAKVQIEKKKVDIPFVSMAVAVVLLLLVLGFVLVKYVLNGNGETPDILQDPYIPVVDNQNDSDKDNTSGGNVINPIDIKQETKIIVTKTGEQNYILTDYDSSQPIVLKMTVGNKETYTAFSINGKETNNPAKGTYKPGQTVELTYYPNLDDEISLHIGYVKGNQFFINDEPLEIDAKYINWEKGLHFYFSFK